MPEKGEPRYPLDEASPDHLRVEELERRVEELERRVEELESQTLGAKLRQIRAEIVEAGETQEALSAAEKRRRDRRPPI